MQSQSPTPTSQYSSTRSSGHLPTFSPHMPSLSLEYARCISPIATLQSPSAARSTAPIYQFSQQTLQELIQLLQQSHIQTIANDAHLLTEADTDALYQLWFACDGMMDVLETSLARVQQQHITVDTIDDITAIIRDQRQSRRLPSLSLGSMFAAITPTTDTSIPRQSSETHLQTSSVSPFPSHHHLCHQAEPVGTEGVSANGLTRKQSSKRHARTTSTPFLPNINNNTNVHTNIKSNTNDSDSTHGNNSSYQHSNHLSTMKGSMNHSQHMQSHIHIQEQPDHSQQQAQQQQPKKVLLKASSQDKEKGKNSFLGKLRSLLPVLNKLGRSRDMPTSDTSSRFSPPSSTNTFSNTNAGTLVSSSLPYSDPDTKRASHTPSKTESFRGTATLPYD